jgi:predicted N-acetyltransferase YhbS
VDEAERGQGIGGEMIRRLVSRLSAVEEIFLLTNAQNADYYSRLGFEVSKSTCLRWPKS